MRDTLINPVDYMANNEPEWYDDIVGSDGDLDLEAELMLARAVAQGRPYRLPDGNNPALVPLDICVAVLEGPGVVADMRAEIEALTGQPAVH